MLWEVYWVTTTYVLYSGHVLCQPLTVHVDSDRRCAVFERTCDNNYYNPPSESKASSNWSNGPKQTWLSQKDGLSLPQELLKLVYTGEAPPGRWREREGRLASAESGVELGKPIFIVLIPGLLRVMAYLLMSRKTPSYPSPYIDSTLRAVSSGYLVCCQSITHF